MKTTKFWIVAGIAAALWATNTHAAAASCDPATAVSGNLESYTIEKVSWSYLGYGNNGTVNSALCIKLTGLAKAYCSTDTAATVDTFIKSLLLMAADNKGAYVISVIPTNFANTTETASTPMYGNNVTGFCAIKIAP